VGREQDAAHHSSAAAKSSYRDAQQRGAMAAHHDHDYPGLSRIRLDYSEPGGAMTLERVPACPPAGYRIISALFGSRTLALRNISDHDRWPRTISEHFGSRFSHENGP
jgi:hypothetical protein